MKCEADGKNSTETNRVEQRLASHHIIFPFTSSSSQTFWSWWEGKQPSAQVVTNLRQVWNSVLYSGKFLGDYWILTHWDCVFDIWLYQHFSLSSGNLSLYPGSYFSLESEDKWVPFDTEDHSMCMAKHLKSFYHGSHSFSKKFQLTLVFPILYF